MADAREVLDGVESFGLISAIDVIEHLDKNAAVSLIQSARHALKPGGALLVQCPCADGFRGAHDLCNDLTHRWAPTSNALQQMLVAAGFERVSLLDLRLPPHPQGARSSVKNLARKLARSAAKPVLGLLGVGTPRIWSNSQIAIAWKASA